MSHPRRTVMTVGLACALVGVGAVSTFGTLARSAATGSTPPVPPTSTGLPAVDGGAGAADIPAPAAPAENPLAADSNAVKPAAPATASVAGLPMPTIAGAIPTSVLTVSDSVDPINGAQLGLAYNTTPYGPLSVLELTKGFTQAAIDQWASPGYCTTCAVVRSVTLSDGARGVLLGTAGDTIAVHWRHPGGAQVTVYAPYPSVSPDAILAAANAIASSLP